MICRRTAYWVPWFRERRVPKHHFEVIFVSQILSGDSPGPIHHKCRAFIYSGSDFYYYIFVFLRISANIWHVMSWHDIRFFVLYPVTYRVLDIDIFGALVRLLVLYLMLLFIFLQSAKWKRTCFWKPKNCYLLAEVSERK